MKVLIIMLPLALLLAIGFLAVFIILALRGQFDDLDSPAHRMLSEDLPHVPTRND